MTNEHRKKLHLLIDQIPELHLEQLLEVTEDYIKNDYELFNDAGEVVPSKKDKKDIKKAKEEYERGEFYTFEEVFGENHENDDKTEQDK
ncbi:hypothetical protein [Bacillus sp. N1-1]|uniref:hypothetical protein n=1 Tax=Bacillus sp. N1-1 TaxID=2682541 RepID=UPI0013180814|nr:hypothetical protein [Bacillus sp. N1-1]QHA92254.1 hypothetical protein GNK04_12905 [Bacillus sp. N1-1]